MRVFFGGRQSAVYHLNAAQPHHYAYTEAISTADVASRGIISTTGRLFSFASSLFVIDAIDGAFPFATCRSCNWSVLIFDVMVCYFFC